MDKWYVYILEMNNWKYYIWSTKNVERRFDEHCRWLTKSTRNNRPLKLLFCKEYDNYQTALEMELYLKRQKSRKVVEDFMGI
jgi:putative endonuclease